MKVATLAGFTPVAEVEAGLGGFVTIGATAVELGANA